MLVKLISKPLFPHSTDVTPFNLMFNLRPLPEYKNMTAKYATIGRPQKLPIPPYCNPFKDGDLVAPMKPLLKFIGDTLSLGDFGISVTAKEAAMDAAQGPPIYSAPERMHRQAATAACDMWSFMCVFAELYLGYSLFSGRSNAAALSDVTRVLGPLPPKWKGTCIIPGTENESWYDLNESTLPNKTLEAKVERLKKDISLEEKELVLAVLKRGLSYDPSERLSAGELLEDPTFNKLLELYGV